MDAYLDLSDFLAQDHLKFKITSQNTFRANSDSNKKSVVSGGSDMFKDVSQ